VQGRDGLLSQLLHKIGDFTTEINFYAPPRRDINF
jgi:hypothetical protein